MVLYLHVHLTMLRFAIAIVSCAPAVAAVCGDTDVAGAYGFQLSGSTTISGLPTPMAAIGRISFDTEGKLSGVSSVNFNGLFLGNPVTGTYEFKPDCSLTWSLQDDSGAKQHFSGKADPGGARVEYHQTDPGTTESRGVLQKTSDDCTTQSFVGRYALSIAGSGTPLGNAAAKMSADATVEADGAGNLNITRAEGSAAGTYTVDSDCTIQIELGLVPDGSAKLRGVLVNSGKEVLAVQTDPERVAVAKLVR